MVDAGHGCLLRLNRCGPSICTIEHARHTDRWPGRPEFSTDRFALQLGLFYAAYFFFGGVQLPFFPLWLEARGLDARTIGLVIAVPMVVRIVATPVITHQADRRRALKATIVIASVAATLGMTLLGLVAGAVAILLIFIVSAVAFSPVLSLTDAYAVSGLRVRGRAYGPVRLWGSVAFIAGNVGAGLLLEWIAPGHLIWLIVASLAVSVVAAVALVPLDAGGGGRRRWRRGHRRGRCCASRCSSRWRSLRR